MEVSGMTHSKARSGASMVGAQVKRERESRLERAQDTKGHVTEFWLSPKSNRKFLEDCEIICKALYSEKR